MDTKYDKQVGDNHYNTKYNYKGRFISYFHQQRIISDIARGLGRKPKVLEAGPGIKFLKKYLTDDISYTSVDIAEDLQPDYIGSITELSKIRSIGKHDIVCAFQVLEHIEYEDSEKALAEMTKVSKEWVFISIPQAYMYLAFWTKVSLLKPFSKSISIPIPRTHHFDGQHYWELGAKGYSKKRFRKSIDTAGLEIVNEFSDPLNPFHRFYLCRKKK